MLTVLNSGMVEVSQMPSRLEFTSAVAQRPSCSQWIQISQFCTLPGSRIVSGWGGCSYPYLDDPAQDMLQNLSVEHRDVEELLKAKIGRAAVSVFATTPVLR
jgi:hypothetical protein